MAQNKYESYTFANEAELISVITGEGYLINEDNTLQSNNIITDTNAGEGDATYLDMHYLGQIPLDEEDPPTMSDEVYCTSARKGNFKIPSNYKTKGQMTKYVWSLNHYGGEGEDEDEVLPTTFPNITWVKDDIIQFLADWDVPTELWTTGMTRQELVDVILAWFE